MKKILFITCFIFCFQIGRGQSFAKNVEFYVPEMVEKKITGSIKIHTEVNGTAYKIGETYEFDESVLFSIYYSDLQLIGSRSENVEVSVEYGNYDYWNEHFNPVKKDRIILENGGGKIYPFKFTVEESAQGSIGIKLKVKNNKNGQESYLLSSLGNSPILFEVDYNLKKIAKNTEAPLIGEDTNEKILEKEEKEKIGEENNKLDIPKEILTNSETSYLSKGEQNQPETEGERIESKVIEEEAKNEPIESITETEEELWEQIKKENSSQKCVQYLRKYGTEGKYYKEVSVKIDELWWKESQKEAANVKDNKRKIKAYSNYLHRTKYGEFRDNAKEKIDDLAWEIANEKGNSSLYLTQLSNLEAKYGDFPKKHSKEVDLGFEIIRSTEKENAFSIEFKNAKLPIKIISYDESNIALEKPEGNIIKGFFGADKGMFDLVVKDKLNREIIVPLDNMVEELKGIVKYDPGKKQFLFEAINGGYAPYYVELRQNKLAVSSQVSVPESTGEVNISSFNQELNGDYELILLDANKRESYNLGIFNLVNQEKVVSEKSSLFWPLTLLGLFLLGILGLLFRQMRSNKRNKIIQKKVNEKTEIHNEMAQSVKIKKKDLQVEEGVKGNYSNKSFLRKSNYKKLDLNQVWQSSKVGNVFLSGETVKDIDEFVKKEKRVSMENETDVPEIGGFLLGQTYQNGQGIDVAIDKFVPIATEKQSVYTVEFGSSAWVELAEIQEDNPEMDLIGWFHTHPGHGLFLSRPDLKIQEGFFSKDHQIALEIDPLTENMDTALFSWKKDGEMNNKEDKSDKIHWFKWTDIAQV